MPVIITLVITFFIGLIPTIRGVKPLISWGIACIITPVFVLFAEFVLPYSGGGASFWPIALVVGGFFGAIVGGLGALIGVAIKERMQ
ncbi:hypothetical protein [Carboxylicivirga marina]|uniref:hypothetical protein n=1 Tax=Carboxylicivirga marina TaxID=2800988 RepID=UPI002595DBBC|nr:hypothetical protein [uncultured Carboxylicivirga sp.]